MVQVFKGFIDQSREVEATNAILKWSQDRLEATNAGLARFVPTEFINALGKREITDVQFGDHVEREMTILFSDIRSFTPLSESMSPQETFEFINSYLTVMTPIIKQHGGFIDKFIGDAIMAIFPDSTDGAVEAAIEMQITLQEFNAGREAEGKVPIRIGIGVHTGEMMLGTVGDKNRMDGTVISDAVNLSARLESLTKHYGLRIAISERTFMNLDDANVYSFRFIGKVKVKGKRDSVSVFEIFDGDPPELLEKKRRAQVFFEQGVAAYFLKRFDESAEMFEKVLEVMPQDTAARVYLKGLKRDSRLSPVTSVD
jgi:class 3 adenylate cyclase